MFLCYEPFLSKLHCSFAYCILSIWFQDDAGDDIKEASKRESGEGQP